MSFSLQSHVDLGPLHTFGLQSYAQFLARINTLSDLSYLFDKPELLKKPLYILGSGSNTIPSPFFEGLVLLPELKGRHLLSEDDQYRYIAAGAGENWHEFVQWTLKQGWGGLENLSLIPGTVGAAPIQNIGAYGVDLSDFVTQVHLYDFQTRSSSCRSAKACHFGYRDSWFKHQDNHRQGRYLITQVVFRLLKNWQPRLGYAELADALQTQTNGLPTPHDIAQAVIRLRQRKLPDPQHLGNAGSFFQNPIVSPEVAGRLLATAPTLPHYPQADGRIKLAAGWLIDKAGWKGRRLGPVGMYEKQALVMVRHETATLSDVLALSQAVQEDVKQQFGVSLIPEPIFL